MVVTRRGRRVYRPPPQQQQLGWGGSAPAAAPPVIFTQEGKVAKSALTGRPEEGRTEKWEGAEGEGGKGSDTPRTFQREQPRASLKRSLS